MRLLLGLALGLALLTQPAAAAPKEEKKDKPAKHEAKAERKAPEPEPEPEPARAPAKSRSASTAPAGPTAKARPSRKQASPTPTTTASPSPVPSPSPASGPTVPAPHVPAAPATTAAPIPAPIAAPAGPRQPARRERRRRKRPSRAVLGFSTTAAAPQHARFVTEATALSPLPQPSPGARRAAPRAEVPARERRRGGAQSPATAQSPAAAAVTRVVKVIPEPFRFVLAGLILLVVLLTVRARRLETERHDLSEDLGLLQSALLPSLPERVGRTWISAAYRPAEGLAAGGDFYDAFPLDAHRTCLLVGDVAGHGRDAIPLTADVRFTLRAYLEAGLAPRAALRATASVIEPRLGGRLVTVVVAVLDSRTGRLAYAAAGHPPPLLAGVDERLVTTASSPAMGTGRPTGQRQTTITLPAGATACFYTDGLPDAKSGGRQIGTARVAAELAALGGRASATGLLERIVRATDSQPDDMVACLLRTPLGAVAPPEERVEEFEIDRPDDGRARRFLLACEVPAEAAEQALIAAQDLLPVVLEVRCGAEGSTVAVHRPDAAALPLI